MILFKEGEIFSGGVARGRQKSFEKALEQLMNYLDAHGGTPDDYRITVGYGYDADEGKRLWMQTRAALRAKYPGAQCEVGLLQIGCTIAVHTGPYALGMGVMRRWKSKIDKQECPPEDDLKCPPRCSGHDSRNSIFIFENREDLRIFPIFFSRERCSLSLRPFS